MEPKMFSQDEWLSELQRSQRSVTIFLTNGFQMRGTIFVHDRYMVGLVDTNNNQQMIYKSAISTIQPV